MICANMYLPKFRKINNCDVTDISCVCYYAINKYDLCQIMNKLLIVAEYITGEEREDLGSPFLGIEKKRVCGCRSAVH